jgi:hypothetical protein
MAFVLLETDVRAGVPCPEVKLRGSQLPRSLSLLGGDSPVPTTLAAGLHVEAYDGETNGLCDYMAGIGFVVVSTRLRAILEDENAKVEFLPLPIVYNGRREIGYSVLRALRVVRGVDMAASIAELDGVGVALAVERLVLNENSFKGAPFVLVRELAAFAASSELSRTILRARCVGCTFVDPGNFRL